MNINFQITNFVPEENLLTVKYFTTDYNSAVQMNIPLPYNEDATKYLSGTELFNFIKSFAPVDIFSERENQNRPDGSEIMSLVIPETLSFEESKEYQLDNLSEAFENYVEHCHMTSSLGFEIDANESANRNITGLLLVTPEDGTVSYCDYNNNFHDLTRGDLEILQREIISNSFGLYAKKWEIREKINQAKTQYDLDMIDFDIFEDFREDTPELGYGYGK